MTAKHRRIAVVVGVVVLVQLAVIVAYVRTKRARERPVAATFALESLVPRPAPPLAGVRQDGTQVVLSDLRGKTVLVHFWATWCKPCRRELPGLLATVDALRTTGRFELLAVSVDDDWHEIASFFDGPIPSAVVRPLEADVHTRFGASTLPDSYLVDASGRLVARYAGARDWRTRDAETHLRAVIASGKQ